MEGLAEGVGGGIVGLGVFLVPIIGSIALFSFLAVASWSDARRKEREAYYTADTLKRISESSSEGAKSAIEYLREQNVQLTRRRIEGMKLGGLITAAVGVGLIIMLRGLEHEEPAYLVGFIPLLIGIALMVYSFMLAPRS
jgi:Flp pilus assembly protein TadB